MDKPEGDDAACDLPRIERLDPFSATGLSKAAAVRVLFVAVITVGVVVVLCLGPNRLLKPFEILPLLIVVSF